MNKYEGELIANRQKLDAILCLDASEYLSDEGTAVMELTEKISAHWSQFQPVIEGWWTSYKKWESEDTWRAALEQDRMSVRTFAGKFSTERSKTVPAPNASFNLDADRFFKNSAYAPLEGEDRARAKSLFDEQMAQTFKAQKGIDSSAFADPKNFATRDAKYQSALHDLSASLLKHGDGLPIFSQVHHKTAPAFFSFVPLSMEADQQVLFKLFRHAKGLPGQPLYQLVRKYRAEMTRVKVAQDFDMATGYMAVPIKLGAQRQERAPTGMQARMAMFEKSRPAAPTYKVRFGLASKTTPTGHEEADTPVTTQIYRARQADALNFTRILRTEHAIRAQQKLQAEGTGFKNEIVIALRQHTAGFPILAFRSGEKPNELQCFTIVAKQMKYNGVTIDEFGAMTPADKADKPPTTW